MKQRSSQLSVRSFETMIKTTEYLGLCGGICVGSAKLYAQIAIKTVAFTMERLIVLSIDIRANDTTDLDHHVV